MRFAPTVVRITYPEPGVWLDLWGGTSGTFNGLDQFNRITDQRWQNSITTTPTDIDRYQYGYDQNSNRLWKANVVGTPVVSCGLDEAYTYDTLNRLTDMQRGTLSSGTISGTPSVEQAWTLDALGNCPTYTTAADGTINLSQTRSANTVNEITAIASTPTWATPPAYDPAGNMTSFPQPGSPSDAFTAVYDAWNRMVSISDTGGTVGTYTYDGRDRRVVKVTNTETRHFYWTNSWQDIEERVGTATAMDKQYVWGIRYIDELLCRDDSAPQRLYTCQDANFNATSLLNTDGSAQQRFLYDPYAASSVFTAAWEFTSDAYSWMPRFTGQLFDAESKIYMYRRRYYQPMIGNFTSRDQVALEKFSNLNLYEYCSNNGIDRLDPLGMQDIQAGWPGNGMIGMLSDPNDPNAPAVWIDASGLEYNGTTSWIGLHDPDFPPFNATLAQRVGFATGLLQEFKDWQAHQDFGCCAQHDLDACTLTAQWMFETGWGESKLTQSSKNLGNIKGAGPLGSVTLQV